MADPRKCLPENISGDFFVDSTCIDCDTCRQIAPATFAETGAYSYVHAQPRDLAGRRDALHALVACPTGSIGTSHPKDIAEAAADFPLLIEDGVYYCGFNSEKSFGGNSYFVRHEAGNWLIDSPRYTDRLVRRFDSFGGIRHIFLTHRDDVADAAKYAHRFGSERIIHNYERSAQPDSERVIEGDAPIALDPDFLAIPTPGHTRGHCVLLYRNRFLFSGDHLWWSRNYRRLNAGRSVCWYSWPQQVASLERLTQYSFDWVLPGHGERAHLDSSAMQRSLADLLEAWAVSVG
jgi:glyoxylase-like metal-dependent hydrolase (beta-lactamase superfamily II)/ferredoxin